MKVQSIHSTESGGEVNFTRKQYEYLEKVFGEVPGSPDDTDAKLRWRSGMRNVILHIRSKVRD